MLTKTAGVTSFKFLYNNRKCPHALYDCIMWRGKKKKKKKKKAVQSETVHLCFLFFLFFLPIQGRPLPNLKLKMLRNRSGAKHTLCKGGKKKKQGAVEIVTLLDGSDYICPPGLE